jgi:hypothetical protein
MTEVQNLKITATIELNQYDAAAVMDFMKRNSCDIDTAVDKLFRNGITNWVLTQNK